MSDQIGAGQVARIPLVNVVTSTGATQTLTKADSGSIVLLDRATLTYTLPAPEVGLNFEFVNTIAAVTAQGITTDAATTFLVGNVNQIIDTSGTSEGQFADGTSHVSLLSNGTTTGGLVGGTFKVRCITATQWMVTGIINSSGTLSTPFA